MAKAVEKLGLVTRLHSVEQRIAQFRPTSEGENSLAPWTAKNERNNCGMELL